MKSFSSCMLPNYIQFANCKFHLANTQKWEDKSWECVFIYFTYLLWNAKENLPFRTGESNNESIGRMIMIVWESWKITFLWFAMNGKHSAPFVCKPVVMPLVKETIRLMPALENDSNFFRWGAREIQLLQTCCNLMLWVEKNLI